MLSLLGVRIPVPDPVVLAIVAIACDLVTWVAFRFDKAQARRRRRRISERTLLVLAVPGGLGAWLGMYGHPKRHKTTKPRFVTVATLGALAQVAGFFWWAWLATDGQLLP